MPAFGAPNVSLHAALRGGAHSVFERSANLLDAFCGSADKPLRHLGALENAARCGKQTHVGDPESGIGADY